MFDKWMNIYEGDEELEEFLDDIFRDDPYFDWHDTAVSKSVAMSNFASGWSSFPERGSMDVLEGRKKEQHNFHMCRYYAVLDH